MLEESMVIAADLADRARQGSHIVGTGLRQGARKNVSLNRGGKLELAFHGLLFESFAVKPRVLQSDGRLIGESGEQLDVARLEGADPAIAKLSIRRGQHADDLRAAANRQS